MRRVKRLSRVYEKNIGLLKRLNARPFGIDQTNEIP